MFISYFLLPLLGLLTAIFIASAFIEMYKDFRKTNNLTNPQILQREFDTKNKPVFQTKSKNQRVCQKDSLSGNEHKIFDDEMNAFDQSTTYRIKLFDINPPQSSTEIEELFVNREKDLEEDVQYFHDAFRSSKINVICGSSRTGKSHYMKKLLLDLEKMNRPFWMKYINANSKETVRYVLHKIFQKLKQGINDLAVTTSRPDVKLVRSLSLDMNKLIDEKGSKTINPNNIKSFLLANKTPISLPNFPDFIKTPIEFIMEGQDCIFTRPEDSELIEFIKFQAEYLIDISEGEYQSILLAIDDVDLLYLTEEGKKDVDYLYKLFGELAESNIVNILITTRRHSAIDRAKDFEFFREIGPLVVNDFTEIYRKRIQLYNQNQEVFTENALTYLIGCAQGKPGIFLNHCKKIFLNSSPPINREDIGKALKRILQDFRANDELKVYVDLITSAVLNTDDSEDSLTLSLPNSVCDTKLLFFAISQANQSGEYEVNKLIKEYLESESKT